MAGREKTRTVVVRYPKLTAAEVENLCALIKSGKTATEIAAELGVDHGTVTNWARKRNLSLVRGNRHPPRPWSPQQTHYLRTAALDGHSAVAIAKALRCSVQTIYNRARTLGVDFRPHAVDPKIWLRLPAALMERLREHAEEMGMSKSRFARLIVVATLRDRSLLDVVT